MIRACRVRDFSTIFTLVGRKAGIYPSRIAALCGLTPSRVGEIITGKRQLAHIDVIERVCDGLRIPGAMVGLAPRPWELPALTAPEPVPGAAVPAPAPAAPEPAADLAEVLHSIDSERVTHSTLTALQSAIEGYWRQDDAHGGAVLRPAVVGQLQYTQQLVKRSRTPEIRAGLQTLAAELSRLAGWAYFDAQQFSTARSYFTQALHLAQTSGDRSFTANVLSCMSLQATYENDPAEAAQLACAAQDIARNTPSNALVMAMLHMREAFAQATLKDAASCHRAIAQSRRHFEEAQGSSAPAWVRYFDETKLLVDTGIALAQLGEHRKAEPLIAEGLRRETHDRQRGRAFHAFWLATTQLRTGHLDQACSTAGLVLDLASAVDSPRVAGHVRQFHADLAPYARETPVLLLEVKMRQVLN